jgi:uncharacterized membrane protein YfcA
MDPTRALVIVVGLMVGGFLGTLVALLFTPLWFLAFVIVLTLPAGWYASHRPWYGRRKKGTFKRFWQSLFGPPPSQSGRDALTGIGIGFPTGLYAFGKIVWGATWT